MSKDVRISVVVNEAQKERWAEVAKEQNRSISDFIRNCVETYLSAYNKHKSKK